MPKILRITTVPISLNVLLRGQFRFMQDHGFEIVTASADGPEVQELIARENVRHYTLPFTRVMSPLTDLKALYETINLIKDVKPDIVHTHTPKAGLIGMLAAKIVGVKHRIHTVAGMPLMEASGITRHILTATERLTYSSATQILPNSMSLATWIRDNVGDYANKIKVIGKGSSNGIDTSHYQTSSDIIDQSHMLKAEMEIDDNDITFSFVGRLVKDKGIIELVDAFEQLSLKYDHIHLLLVGDYEDEREPIPDNIKQIIDRHERIYAVGFQKDIRPYLAASDVFVFPSYREGFPNVVLQAGSMGLPSIVTDINGSNEIITDNHNGLIVESKNSIMIRDAMEMLMDEDKRKRLEQNARKGVMVYDQKAVWQELLDTYKLKLSLAEHTD